MTVRWFWYLKIVFILQATCLTSFFHNQFQTPSIGNVSNGDTEFDPAILAVGRGRVQNGLNISNLDVSKFSSTIKYYWKWARLQLLMQRSLSPHQNQRSVDVRDNFSPFTNDYGISSRVVEQTLVNNLTTFSHRSFPQSSNSVMSNGQWEWVESCSEWKYFGCGGTPSKWKAGL